MYLLNLGVTSGTPRLGEFTFHYVSIKSFDTAVSSSKMISFTFHYVSIKSLH